MKHSKAILALVCAFALIMSAVACAAKETTDDSQETAADIVSDIVAEEVSAELQDDESADAPAAPRDAEPERNGEIYVLFTSDVHCGVDQGFGYAGLKQIRDTLEARGYTTILVDDGDSIQGEAIGTLSKGETIVKLMNDVGYDVAIPGNHEFDYGMDRFLELSDMAEYQYISCNFNHQGELVFEPYVIVEAAGQRIAFIGVTTPETMASSTPANFQNGDGEYIYGFFQDDTGEGVYTAVQSAVDAARSPGRRRGSRVRDGTSGPRGGMRAVDLCGRHRTYERH